MAGENFKEIMSSKGDEGKAPPAQEQASRKIGEGHAMGMARLGFHELTNALQAFPDSNINPMEEPGVFGNENAPQRISPQEKTVNKIDSGSKESTQPSESSKEVSLKEILDAPAPPMTPTMERDNGREM